MPSFSPCLHGEADTRIFAGATEAAKRPNSSNGWHSGLKIFKPEKNLVFFQAKILRP